MLKLILPKCTTGYEVLESINRIIGNGVDYNERISDEAKTRWDDKTTNYK